MSRTRTLAALCSALALTSALMGTDGGKPESIRDPLKGLDAYVRNAMREWDLPGVAVAVVKDDRVAFAKGYGVREIGKGEAVDEDTLFAIGSITKGFTATALAMLIEEKKIEWDAPATDHLKGFRLYEPYATRELTVRDLLCHRSGLGRGSYLLWYGQPFDRTEILRRIRFLKPNSSFRSTFGYQNIMVTAAGQIIPAVAEVSWDDFVKSRIFGPLGMKRSNTSTRDLPALANVAAPHTRVGGKIVAIPYRNIDNIGPAGSINSSVMEMAQWLRFQLGNGKFGGKQLLDPAVLQDTRNPQMTMPIGPDEKKNSPTTHLRAYGLGWVLEDYRGRLIVWHDGGIDGMVSQAGFLPEENLGIVVLTNSDRNNLEAGLFYRIVDGYLGPPVRDWSQVYLTQAREREAEAQKAREKIRSDRIADTRPSHEIGAYCGKFRHEMYGQIEVRAESGRLMIDLNARPMGALAHWHYDTFRIDTEVIGSLFANADLGDLLVTFRLNSQGRVMGLEIGELAIGLFERGTD